MRNNIAPEWLTAELASTWHIAAAEALALELKEAGVTAVVMAHAYPNMPLDDHVEPMPECFSALTYIPDDRAEFYGSDSILAAASRLPHIKFNIIGGTGRGITNVAPNVRFLGWKEDPAETFREASCVIRMVRHDGGGGTMLEALAHGRPVVYSREQEHVIFVPFGDTDGLVSALSSLYERHKVGELRENRAVALAIRARYAPPRCYETLANWLTTIRDANSQPVRSPSHPYGP